MKIRYDGSLEVLGIFNVDEFKKGEVKEVPNEIGYSLIRKNYGFIEIKEPAKVDVGFKKIENKV